MPEAVASEATYFVTTTSAPYGAGVGGHQGLGLRASAENEGRGKESAVARSAATMLVVGRSAMKRRAPHGVEAPSPMAEGKRRLMEAAVRLAGARGSTRGLGLRELAREAGLNHNTFYRHFPDMETMFEAIIADLAGQLRRGLRSARHQVPPGTVPTRVVLGWCFDFADQHRDAFVVAARELHGPPGPVREAMRAVADLGAKEMARELLELGHLPRLDRSMWERLLRVHSTNAFDLCLSYLENPGQRAELIDSAEELFEVLVAGAVARSRPSVPRRATTKRARPGARRGR